MKQMSKKGSLLMILCALVVALMAVSAVAAAGALVSSGEFNTFASGLDRGYDISGHARMVRTAAGDTLTSVQVRGLAANTTYPAHVHNAPCAVGNGGGHYQHAVGGPVDDVNEIWPGFTTNASGHGNAHARNDFWARPEAQSVVVHDTDGARIACADLQ